MKVLIFNAYYYPETAASLYLTDNVLEELAKRKINAELYVPTPTRGVTKDQRFLYSHALRRENKFGGYISVTRFHLFCEKKNSFMRAFRYFLSIIIQFFYGLKSKNIDVIYYNSTPPINCIMVALLKKLKKTKVVYHLQDIFPDSLVNTGLTNNKSFLCSIGSLIENISYKTADKIIVISEDFKKNILAKGVPQEKIDVIYNWVDENAVINIHRKDNVLFDKFNIDRNKFYITYCGNIGFTQNMEMLIQVAKKLEEYRDICFVIIGDGAFKPQLEKLIENNGICNIKLLPFQDYEDISHVFSLGDVGLIISKKGVGTNSVPSKTWSIMSAERPVLASFDNDSELNKILKNGECGICVEPDDCSALTEKILYLRNNIDVQKKYGHNGRAFVINNISRTKSVDKLVGVIKDTLYEQNKDDNKYVFKENESEKV